jgi:hypothetical protein
LLLSYKISSRIVLLVIVQEVVLTIIIAVTLSIWVITALKSSIRDVVFRISLTRIIILILYGALIIFIIIIV